MMTVECTASHSLGELARELWLLSTGRNLRTTRTSADPWPPTIEPQVEDATIAISRTLPTLEGQQPVREIEKLYLDMIAAAQRYIVIENQYFTAHAVGEALAARLAEPDGPEVVLVLRLLSHGWLEELTMQNLRRNL